MRACSRVAMPTCARVSDFSLWVLLLDAAGPSGGRPFAARSVVFGRRTAEAAEVGGMGWQATIVQIQKLARHGYPPTQRVPISVRGNSARVALAAPKLVRLRALRAWPWSARAPRSPGMNFDLSCDNFAPPKVLNYRNNTSL